MITQFNKADGPVSVSRTNPLPVLPGPEKVYRGSIVVIPTGAGDYFGYIENQGDRDLHVAIESIIPGAAEKFTIEGAAAGTPAGPTTVNLSRKAGAELIQDVVCQQGVNLDSASGLKTSDAYTVATLKGAAGAFGQVSLPISVGRGRALQFKSETGTTEVIINLAAWFE